MTEWRVKCAEVLREKVSDQFALVNNIVSEVLHIHVLMEHACNPTCSMHIFCILNDVSVFFSPVYPKSWMCCWSVLSLCSPQVI